MPGITLTNGSDVFYARLRGMDPDLFWNLYMLDGNDQLYTAYPSSMRVFLGAGDDYAQINEMYQVIIYGESGNDIIDINNSSAWTVRIDGGDGEDRVSFLVDKYITDIAGGPGNDRFYGNGHSITGGVVRGDDGDDLFAGFGNYGEFAVTLFGGKGNDTYQVTSTSPPVIVENVGEGRDTIELVHGNAYVLPSNVENLIITGGTALPTSVTGNASNNHVSGGAADDVISGLGGNDMLYGLKGNDILKGGAGADLLKGRTGDDWLQGDSGRDQMWGGTGADTFVFGDSHFGGATASTCDVIHDFSRTEGDKVRLTAVDANELTAVDDPFHFIGTGQFTGQAGQLRYTQLGGNTYLQGDLDGDSVSDFWIKIDGLHQLLSSDFFL